MPLEKFAQPLRKRHPTHFWSGPLWALFEQLITGSLFNHHTIMNTTKATPDHHKCEFAAFRLSKFFSPSATGVWGIVPQRGFARPTLFWSGVWPSQSRSPQGETLHHLACWRKHQLVCWKLPQHILENLNKKPWWFWVIENRITKAFYLRIVFIFLIKMEMVPSGLVINSILSLLSYSLTGTLISIPVSVTSRCCL